MRVLNSAGKNLEESSAKYERVCAEYKAKRKEEEEASLKFLENDKEGCDFSRNKSVLEAIEQEKDAELAKRLSAEAANDIVFPPPSVHQATSSRVARETM